MPDERPKIHPSIESTLSHTISNRIRIRGAFFQRRTQLIKNGGSLGYQLLLFRYFGPRIDCKIALFFPLRSLVDCKAALWLALVLKCDY